MIKIREKLQTNLNLQQLTNRDKVFLQALVKRQFMLLKDMYTFHDAYPTILDSDVVGSFDTLFRVLADVCDKQLTIN